MSIAVTLLLLRILSALLLFSFMVAIFVIIWKDLQAVNRQLRTTHQSYGHLRKLLQVDGNTIDTNESYALLPFTSIGRSLNNTIVIEDTFASSEHAQVILRDGQWWLEDKQSRNGTRLNDTLIEEAIIITDGDIIQIGNTSFLMKLH